MVGSGTLAEAHYIHGELGQVPLAGAVPGIGLHVAQRFRGGNAYAILRLTLMGCEIPDS